MYGSWFLRQLRFPAPFVVGPALHWLAARWVRGAGARAMRGAALAAWGAETLEHCWQMGAGTQGRC